MSFIVSFNGQFKTYALPEKLNFSRIKHLHDITADKRVTKQTESEFEEESYFEQIEMTSYLRSFKELDQIPTMYAVMFSSFLQSQYEKIAREAYEYKSSTLKLMKGEKDVKLPL